MNTLPSYWIPSYVYAETWSSIITGCLSICHHSRRHCLSAPLGDHFYGSLPGTLASWLASRTKMLLLLLRGVSIYTANKLNFSFMTPTTVCPVVGGWMPSQRRQTIVWQLSKVCRAAPATPPRRTDVYIWLVISQRRPRRWHQVQVGSTWPAEKSLPPYPLFSTLCGCFVSHLALCCRCHAMESFGCLSKASFGGLKAHSLFVSLKISSWA